MEDPGVDRYHLIIQRKYTLYLSQLLVPTHSCRVFIDPRNLCGSSRLGTLSYPLTLFLRSSSQNRSFSRIPFGCRGRCGGVLMMGSLPSSSAVSPQMEPERGFWFSKPLQQYRSKCPLSTLDLFPPPPVPVAVPVPPMLDPKAIPDLPAAPDLPPTPRPIMYTIKGNSSSPSPSPSLK